MNRKDRQSDRQSPRLSQKLGTLLDEAQSLLNLKGGFGRLPDSAVRRFALNKIDDWFEDLSSVQEVKESKTTDIAGLESDEGDDIPF